MTKLALGLAIAVGLLVLAGVIVLFRRWRRRRRQVLWEDALKQVCSARQDGRPLTPSEIGGRLGLSPTAMLRLVQGLEAAGLVRFRAGLLELTETGEQLGLQVLRGHRLWEQYLAGDAQLPVSQLHRAAERAEHRFATKEIDALADHLGHPRTDPHGDLVPNALGALPMRRRTPLTDWPLNRLAVVDHVEDEPHEGLKEALRAGLRPGTILRVVERSAEGVVCETPEGRCTLTPAAASGVDVCHATDAQTLKKPGATLADLPLGQEAEILALSDRCTGLPRRRLLDLGLTEGARIRAALSNLGGEARVYEVRDTMIALRKEQAEQILIKPASARLHGPAGRRDTRP